MTAVLFLEMDIPKRVTPIALPYVWNFEAYRNAIGSRFTKCLLHVHLGSWTCEFVTKIYRPIFLGFWDEFMLTNLAMLIMILKLKYL